MNSYKGKLFFFENKGPKDGYWALQDLDFISYQKPKFGLNSNQKVWDINKEKKTGTVIEQTEVLIDGNWLELPDPICNDEDYRISSLLNGEGKGNLEADKRLMKRYNFKLKYIEERLNEMYEKNSWHYKEYPSKIILQDGSELHLGITPTSVPSRPYGITENGLTKSTIKWENNNIEYNRLSTTLLIESWDMKGLRFLENGDTLTIYKENETSIAWSGKLNFDNSHPRQPQIKEMNFENWNEFFNKNYLAKLEK